MSKPTVEYFFSFRSPYSYLSGPRAFDLPRRFPVNLVYRGVRPMAMRGQPLPRSKQLYILRDSKRVANHLGMQFGKIHDPIGDGVWRCLTIAEYAATQGSLAEFVLAASRAIWAEGIDVTRDAELQRICDGIGLNWDGCVTAMANAEYRERVEQNTARLAELGQWGVPTFVFNGQSFWGQDRMQDLEQALSDSGLKSCQ